MSLNDTDIPPTYEADDRETTPRVTVVIPAYNAESSIRAALNDVLGQTFLDLEVIVCDDGSTDGTAEAARDTLAGGPARVPWRIYTLGRYGAAGARNYAIRAARGEFVAFLDDDDRWAPEKLEASLAAIDDDGLDLVCHSEFWVDQEGTRQLRVYRDLFNPAVHPVVSLMRNNPLSTSAVVVRREALITAGLFDESLPSAEDYDLWIRLAALPGFRMGFIDRALGEYALREGSESSKIQKRHRALSMIGERYRSQASTLSRWGPLEYWAYRARTEFTTGVRYVGQRRYARGVYLALKGLAMWPFRLDWVAFSLRQRSRQRDADEYAA
jgi:glycosyltransferase involved in cell wall biosynthesis